MPTNPYMYANDLIEVLKKKHASGTYKSLVKNHLLILLLDEFVSQKFLRDVCDIFFRYFILKLASREVSLRAFFLKV